MHKKCKKCGARDIPSHTIICHALPPLEDIKTLLKAHPVSVVARKLGTSVAIVETMVKSFYGVKEYEKLSRKQRRGGTSKTDGKLRCGNCFILLTKEDTGMTCNYCRGEGQDERPSLGWWQSPRMVRIVK